jgi:hypothetical protein
MPTPHTEPNTPPPIAFTLPAEDTDDPLGIPTQITHGCDYMHTGGDELEFFYNFLSYQWTIDGRVVGARCYFDEIERVSVDVSRTTLAHAAFAPLLEFLQRRFAIISTMEDDIGYVVGWERQNNTNA